MINLVCEVCYNHCGDIEKAKDIIDSFIFCDVFKFQKMSPKNFLREEIYNKDCDDSPNYFGFNKYGAYREYLELSIEEHKELKKYIEDKGKKYACSVCDIESAKEILMINPEYVKIPSCRCNDFELLKYVFKNFFGDIHISTGMTSAIERKRIAYDSRTIFYNCVSNYNNEGDIYIEDNDGFSCHVPDIFYAKAAILNGAKYIEYHCTKDRNAPGSDNKISLLPDEYNELQEWITENKSKIDRIKFKKPDDLLDYEKNARDKFWKCTA